MHGETVVQVSGKQDSASWKRLNYILFWGKGSTNTATSGLQITLILKSSVPTTAKSVKWKKNVM